MVKGIIFFLIVQGVLNCEAIKQLASFCESKSLKWRVAYNRKSACS